MKAAIVLSTAGAAKLLGRRLALLDSDFPV